MDLPINVDVICGSQISGRSTCLIVNPVSGRVTHVVVAEKEFPNAERLVPVETIRATTATSIELDCTAAQLSKMEPFLQSDFIDSGNITSSYPFDVPYMIWPYSMYEAMPMPLEHERIPVGEVPIHRGASVRATDGAVGRVDEFLVDQKNDFISHLVLREGHLWGQKDVTIPVSEIEKITADTVYLKMNKQDLAKLPAIPVTRKWK